MVYPVTFKFRKRKKQTLYSLVNNNLPKFFQPRDILGKRCETYLRNKFIKYKRRHVIVEDADIILISNQLGQQLQVRSPLKENSLLKIGECKHVAENYRPKNYLFRMGKLREKASKSNSNSNSAKTTPDKNKVCDQETKKHTNAFQVLMSSRNKRIGSNSPGKELIHNEIILEETIQKRQEKIKRKLVLQNMANAKGALEKQAKEKYQEKIIKKKLQKRADLLKDMLLRTNEKSIDKQNFNNYESAKETRSFKSEETDIDSKKSNKQIQPVHKDGVKTKAFEVPKSSENKTKKYDKNKLQQTKTDTTKSPNIKAKSTEDEEFLTKLSPSIKKKENMLCYFQKIDKSDTSTTIVDDCDDNPDIFDDKIKVKRRLKKKHKIKLKSILADNDDDIPLHQLFRKDVTQSKTDTVVKCNNKDKSVTNENMINRKRKHKEKKNTNTKADTTILSDCKECPINENNRPKRNIKRPVKYSDDINLSSSDEEFSTVTSKKRKHIEKENVNHKELNLNLRKKNQLEAKHVKVDFDNKTKSGRKQNLNSVSRCKPEKLAPIFKSKTVVDLAALEAKQKFLQSGIPDQLKKIMIQKKVQQIIVEDLFIPTVHINQSADVKYPDFLLHIIEENDNYDTQCKYDELSLNKYFKHISKASNEYNSNVLIPVDSIQKTLDAIKQGYPEFPVYRTYKNFKNKMKGHKHIPVTELDSSNDTTHDLDEDLQEDPNSLPWVDKYRALSSKEVIGNFDSMKEIKKWLVTWKENNMNAKKQQSKEDSDFSDFYDSDSRESYRMSDNLMIVMGPTGCGKTSGVYAVAAELSIKVIEVNVSSKRTGKIMLQDLHEATQSHKVNRGTSSKENSQNSLGELKADKKKRGRPPKINFTSSQVEEGNTKQTGMSLILIDDADIVFEQDDGFTSAISQLVQSSKRPVIVVTTSLNSQHLQKFAHCKTIIKMKALSPKMLGTWLDVMCLADSSVCQPGTGAKLLEYFNGDVRKCINYLQFIICSGKTESTVFDTPNSEENCTLLDIQDETSNQSWVGNNTENICHNITSQKESKPATTNIDFLKIEKKNMFDITTVWWNIPKQLSCIFVSDIESGIRQVENVFVLCDTISFSDSIMGGTRGTNSISSNPWQVFETDSVSEIETSTEYNRSIEYLQEMSRCLIETSLMKSGSNPDIIDILEVPGMTAKRSYEKAISGHTTLSESLNLSSVLDRKSIALDYWPTFRTICRSERVKTDSKRNNRFTHYLKSTKMSSSAVFERLSTSLNS